MKHSAELFNVLPPDEALQRLLSRLAPIHRFDLVSLTDALDRVTALDLVSPVDLPSFARSTMDGFGVIAASTHGASESIPAYLKLLGEMPMGRATTIRVAKGEAARVHTGSMLPLDGDAVVMVEDTEELSDGSIEVRRPVASGENVLQPGEDVCKGDAVFRAGHRLRPQDIGALAALGITDVQTYARPVVAILSTGDEVVYPEAEPHPGQVRDINSYTASALVTRAGGLPRLLGIVPDDYPLLEHTAREGLARADALIISAGSSVSTRDMTARAITALGEPGVLVHGVSLKPGKPTILAVVDGKPVFGLPGNPVSAFVVFQLFVAPAIRLLGGARADDLQNTTQARLARNIASVAGREDYVPVRLDHRDGELWATPVLGKSNLIFTLVHANGLVKIPLDIQGLRSGEIVTVQLM